jgi:hypothetical protein
MPAGGSVARSGSKIWTLNFSTSSIFASVPEEIEYQLAFLGLSFSLVTTVAPVG